MHPADNPALPGKPQEELVPIAEGAQRLGLAHDSVRKKLSAGTLRGEKRAGRWWVWVLAADAIPDAARQEPGNPPATSGTLPDASIDGINAIDPRELINRLEQENAYLRQTLDAEIEARRRADVIVARLTERLPEIALIASQDAQNGPGRVTRADLAESPLHQVSRAPVTTEVSLAMAWRRWWRKITGG